MCQADKPLRIELVEPLPIEHPLAQKVSTAWATLTTMRPVTGFGISCIPWDKVMYYAKVRYNLELEQAVFFTDIAMVADALYIEHLSKTVKKDSKLQVTMPGEEPPPTPSPKKPRRRA